ncbi:MAG: ion channel [Mariprofundus sp.]
MLLPLILGGFTVVLSMAIQVAAVVLMVRYVIGIMADPHRETDNFSFDTLVLSAVLLLLFAGHLAQIAIWGALFVQVGEFDSFQTAFYHSAVNFAALGYGDIVMSEKWRLLGALEAGNGVLMFGLSAGTIFAVMTRLFARRKSSATLENGRKN